MIRFLICPHGVCVEMRFLMDLVQPSHYECMTEYKASVEWLFTDRAKSKYSDKRLYNCYCIQHSLLTDCPVVTTLPPHWAVSTLPPNLRHRIFIPYIIIRIHSTCTYLCMASSYIFVVITCEQNLGAHVTISLPLAKSHMFMFKIGHQYSLSLAS